MTVKSENNPVENENIVDDISNESVPSSPPPEEDKMAALKAKLAKKENVPIKIVEKKTKSIKIGVVGSGQAGSRLAEAFYNLGYDAVAFNTAPQDLEHIQMPEANKFLLVYTLGGAAKDLDIGRQAAEAHKDAINELIHDKLADSQVIMLCLSLGGGSGAGSCETMIDILSAIGKPIIVITVLPMSADDARIKRNALETLSKLAKETQNRRIHNLIVVDNAKIEAIYSNVSPVSFYGISNKAIVSPIDAFNSLSVKSSQVKPLDPMEWAKILTDGGGLTVYGEMTVANYEDTTCLAEAIVENLNSGLLASDFDLKQSKYVGYIVVGREHVLNKITNQHLSYAEDMLNETCGTPNEIMKGIYIDETVEDDVLKVYSIFSGLGLPDVRVQQLKKDAAEHAAKVKSKDTERNLNLKLDTGKDDATSAVEKIRQQIGSKKSAFGGLLNSVVQDRRKK